MIIVKRVLVAVDFSAVSANAMRYAVAVARQFSATLDVVNALRPDDIELPANASAQYGEEMRQGALQKRRKELSKFVKQHAAKLTDVNEFVRLGSPTEEVIEAAKELHADLIVIGTHGRTGLKHLLVGSVAESVLRHADVPVLCIRSPA